nr:MAG TPA: hypothetical protein [Caudoviricetes sp.]
MAFSFPPLSSISHNFCKITVLLFNACVMLSISVLCVSFMLFNSSRCLSIKYFINQHIIKHMTMGKPIFVIAVVISDIAMYTLLSLFSY